VSTAKFHGHGQWHMSIINSELVESAIAARERGGSRVGQSGQVQGRSRDSRGMSQ
jgi:hypothetical protein